jgi:hypothetical protein
MITIGNKYYHNISRTAAMSCCSRNAVEQIEVFQAAFLSKRTNKLRPFIIGLLPTSIILALSGGGVCQAAQGGADSLAALQQSITAQENKLKVEEQQIEQQSLELSQQQQLLDTDMAKLRGTGTNDTSQAPATDNTVLNSPVATPTANTQQAQTTQEAPPSEAVGQQQQQQQQQNQSQQTKIILQSSTALTNAGGVLTPKGQFVVDPSLEYDYWAQNQLALNGFTIIPGITFGNIFISRVEQNFLTAAVTLRYGVTNDWEVNVKIPYVIGYGTTTTQAVGPNATPLSPGANNAHIGDIQFGTSYQFNSGNNGWPVFVGNFLFKTVTGESPFEVPIFTVNDPNGQFLAGIEKKLPTGTGFYSLEPSLTVFYPTAPGVIFANFQYIENFSRTFNILTPAGGAAVRESLQPGNAVAATFGLGFAMNDKASMTFSYQQEHVFGASEDGQSIDGSSYDFGTFNFGLGYTVNAQTSINLGVGIGAGPNAPVAKILVDVPVRFN